MEETSTKTDTSIGDILQYYEVRMGALSDYSDRVWNRFNWFLTLQLAVFGLFFTQLDKLASQPVLAIGVPVVGVVLALLWFLLGAEDYVSARKHGARTNEVEKRVKEAFLGQGLDFDVSVRTTFVKFRQTWLLFAFPILVVTAWVLIAVLL